MNDLPEIAKFAKFILYANDANILVTSDTLEDAYEKLDALVSLNGLCLNLKKTNNMILHVK